MECVELTGSDNRMDCQDMFYDPLNPLPVKCASCGFPDLDHVPNPYFLVKSRTMSPNELAPAENGNFLVRERVRRVLELVGQGNFTFHPTHFRGTDEQTPWSLAVPVHQVKTADVKPEIHRCPTCNEPKSAHPGSQHYNQVWGGDIDHLAVKSSTWGSCTTGWQAWTSRDLFFTVRLFTLIKKLKAKGLIEQFGDNTKPNAEESEWVKNKLSEIETAGIPLHPAGSLGDAEANWLKQFLKANAKPGISKPDWKVIEKDQRIKLPKSYKDFIDKIGPYSFLDVDEEGFNANVMPPDEIDFRTYRLGVFESSDDEPHTIDAIEFASTDHGDCFCFDVRKGQKEYAVYQYLHEGDYFEPYADNFAACIRRFAVDNG